MKIWRKYQDYLFNGEWHIHTNFTDGTGSIAEYSEKAVELGIPLLAFTEHVRKELNYDFRQFLNEINIARRNFPSLIILSGCEAKVLPDGKLNCPSHILEKVDYKLFAFHSFPVNIEKYILSIKNVINNYDIDTWAHPGLFLKKNPNLTMPENELNNIFKIMSLNKISLEINLKYNLPQIDWIKKYKSISQDGLLIFGGDIHSIEDLYISWQIKQNLQKKWNNLNTKERDSQLFEVWFIENYPNSVKIMKTNPDYQY
ncbi:phosphatase YcdX [subsurface metagenome]